MQSGKVERFYDEAGENEWKRLELDPVHNLEWLTTTHFMEKYLPDGGRALDAGGGPGRYSIYLAKKGFKVVLLDLSKVQLDIARSKLSRSRLPPGSIELIKGRLPDLSQFPDASFDVVVCLGALTHLIERRERERAISELVRVAKTGAPLFISVISRYGVFRTVLQKVELHETLIDPGHQEAFEEGIHHGHPGIGPGMFTDAYYFTPDGLRASFERRGVKVLTIAGCEGLADHLGASFNILAKDKRRLDRWMDIHWRTCTESSVIGNSEHILLVGRKRRSGR